MKRNLYLLLCILIATASCKKGNKTDDDTIVNIEAVRLLNANKVTVTNGVWGTVSTIQGNCMPTTDPKSSTCKAFAIQREVRIYAYTNKSNALPASPVNGLYDSFNTTLIKTVTTDGQGFYEATLPDGKYTIVFVEDGKLYADTYDDQGGITPVVVQHNKFNLNMVLQRAAY